MELDVLIYGWSGEALLLALEDEWGWLSVIPVGGLNP